MHKYSALKQHSSADLSEKLEAEKQEKLTELNHIQERVRHENSYIGKIGKSIEPAIQPLGFDWKMGVSCLAEWQPRKLCKHHGCALPNR
ncbi:nucleoside recognition domain-containing protein [Marinilabilia salmonicolor]|uniref:nucleoside recognition domain-containing protein n=1 Tax=Marinilabilia salmonicolor TaxID=989 RepID=UPI000A72E1A7|nr:nucleoside recognition domain-containing protein [Marinilabilia salmonicolor]